MKEKSFRLALVLGLCCFQWSVLGFSAPKTTEKAPAQTPALVEKGKVSYITNCVLCHGDKGDGNGVAGAALNPKPRDFNKDKFKAGDKVEQIFATVTNGLKDTSMAGYSYLPAEERWALAYYVRSFRKK